jgi:hypothetical protein
MNHLDIRSTSYGQNKGRECRNPSFGLVTKAKGCKVAGQEEGSPGVRVKALQGCGPKRSWRVTSHTLGSVRKCEGV